MVGFGDASTICGRDLVVLGSGAAGLTTALTRVHHGLRPLVVEHAERIGGTSARSSGTVRIPGNHHLETRGIHDDAERASLVGDRGKRAMWQAFLAEGRRMLLELETRSGIVFRAFMTAPDHRQNHDGAAPGGRALEPLFFDGRLLGRDFDRLAWPLPELMLFGGMMVTRVEASELRTTRPKR